jgi:peptidoglycan/xylan/chitin deacetylase (PgdA/CDA1 family)
LAAPKALWKMPAKGKVIYLTFDDGPVKGITDRLLSLLEKNEVKATFFCLGKNAKENPELVSSLRNAGHSIGHHSFSHLKGWQTDDRTYLEDVEYAADIIGGNLFRPPYGKLKTSQLRYVGSMYTVVMWSLMPGDFDPEMSAEQCLKLALESSKSGDIVVFHDNQKCGEKMLEIIERYLPEMKLRGYSFATL